MEWVLGQSATSLHEGSKSTYVRGQVRVVGHQMLRIQGRAGATNKWEETIGPVSASLCEYIAALPQTCPSTANSGAMYAPCLFRREGLTSRVRVQLAGPAHNRPFGIEFILPKVGHAATMPVGPAAATAKPAESAGSAVLSGLFLSGVADSGTIDHGFKVGDAVVVVKEGDGCNPPCEGGPSVGTKATIHSFHTDGADCGGIKLELEYGSKWTTTPAHIKLVQAEAPSVATSPLAASLASLPPSFLAAAGQGAGLKTLCVNCGNAAGVHYPGGLHAKFSPSLCPQPDAVCPHCGPVGPVPTIIHTKLVCPHKDKIADDGVPF